MARTAIVIQTVLENAALQPLFSAADAANGMAFPNDGKTELIVINGDASSKTVTLTSVPCSHGRTQDLAVVVAAGKTAVFPKLDPALWNQPVGGTDGGSVRVDFSAATSVTVAAVRRG